jgi:WD40 repeat protein
LDYEMSPPDIWCGHKSQEYAKSRSNLEVTHEDYSNAIEAHPLLPQFVTGNAKGLLCLWNFNQSDDKSLDQWVTDPDIKNVNPKKGTIKKIAFSKYGDKLVCSSMEGSVFMFKFDTAE